MKKMSVQWMNRKSLQAALAAFAISALLAGCGGATEQQKNNDFFTSGNRDADQRADQRMAKDQQLKDTPAANADANKSLYDRLGGQSGISSIVDDFLPRVMADPRVNWDRKGVVQGGFSIHHDRSMEWDATPANVQQLKTHLIQFIALATGGPSQYQGRDMKAAHARLHISNPEFDASLGDLKASLDKLNVPVKEQKELLSIVESTRPQIVEER